MFDYDILCYMFVSIYRLLGLLISVYYLALYFVVYFCGNDWCVAKNPGCSQHYSSLSLAALLGDGPRYKDSGWATRVSSSYGPLLLLPLWPLFQHKQELTHLPLPNIWEVICQELDVTDCKLSVTEFSIARAKDLYKNLVSWEGPLIVGHVPGPGVWNIKFPYPWGYSSMFSGQKYLLVTDDK